MAHIADFLSASDRLAALEASDELELAQLTARSDELLSANAQINMDDLRAWWVEHRSTICKWAKKLQSYWMTRFGLAALGRFLQKIVQVIDRFLQIQDQLCT